MCVKLPPRDLNPSLCPPHFTSIYTYKIISAPRVRGGMGPYAYLNEFSLWAINVCWAMFNKTKKMYAELSFECNAKCQLMYK